MGKFKTTLEESMHVQNAFWQLDLPLIASRPILGQIMSEDAIGFFCIDADGAILELNRRGHELASKYREAAGITHEDDLLREFVKLAQSKKVSGWQLVHASGETVLEVRVHELAKEAHMLSTDVHLVKMQEWVLPQPPRANDDFPPELSCLTPRQLEIALLLGRTCMGYKQIAGQLGITEGTARTHVEHIYRALKVHSRPEIIAIVNRRKR